MHTQTWTTTRPDFPQNITVYMSSNTIYAKSDSRSHNFITNNTRTRSRGKTTNDPTPSKKPRAATKPTLRNKSDNREFDAL